MTRPSLVVSFLAFACITPALAGLDAGNSELGFELGYTHFDRDITVRSRGNRLRDADLRLRPRR